MDLSVMLLTSAADAEKMAKEQPVGIGSLKFVHHVRGRLGVEGLRYLLNPDPAARPPKNIFHDTLPHQQPEPMREMNSRAFTSKGGYHLHRGGTESRLDGCEAGQSSPRTRQTWGLRPDIDVTIKRASGRCSPRCSPSSQTRMVHSKSAGALSLRSQKTHIDIDDVDKRGSGLCSPRQQIARELLNEDIAPLWSISSQHKLICRPEYTPAIMPSTTSPSPPRSPVAVSQYRITDRIESPCGAVGELKDAGNNSDSLTESTRTPSGSTSSARATSPRASPRASSRMLQFPTKKSLMEQAQDVLSKSTGRCSSPRSRFHQQKGRLLPGHIIAGARTRNFSLRSRMPPRLEAAPAHVPLEEVAGVSKSKSSITRSPSPRQLPAWPFSEGMIRSLVEKSPMRNAALEQGDKVPLCYRTMKSLVTESDST